MSDWSSDVCSSDLGGPVQPRPTAFSVAGVDARCHTLGPEVRVVEPAQERPRVRLATRSIHRGTNLGDRRYQAPHIAGAAGARQLIDLQVRRCFGAPRTE